ncbi:acetyl-CoA hydrolase/transferase family protein [Bhargavaea beijingensis]|uniref:acetyl-CoA hydrolase/transferase family protein n=1 Tax=Bhargavaea beijingensis TaxID=426756 RepID=UPI0022241D63|nr:acetyl-CoA hydrolase/transferase C-terminal domain-containing protein [Bhargavaea beijingensis]MCW1929201.1 propionyl-CoA--succinate CoA transferase [Bhargavaea beijingensis]
MTKEMTEQEFLSLIRPGDDLVVPIANGEPFRLLDILEAHAENFNGVRIHQMHALRERRYINGEFDGHLNHISYFLSGATRKAYHNGTIELVPNNFSDVPYLLRRTTKLSMVLAKASPMDEHGYFSLGTNADYVAEFIGNVPFVLEVNENMPRTFGQNQIHISQIKGFIRHDEPLVQTGAPPVSEKDIAIAEEVAERIEDGDTIQVGIGAIPNAAMSMLKDRRHLGIHTEMLTSSVVDLYNSGAIDGTRKATNRGKIICTFALGDQKLYDFLHDNPGVEFQPVHIVNNPARIALEDHMVSINASTEIDLYGQAASETVAGKYYSLSGGQADFANGVRFSKYGKGFICLHSTAKDDTISRIKVALTPGSVVTTSKNSVGSIVTEYGVADLYGQPFSERARRLISIAHPKFREELEFEAKRAGFFI